MGRLSLAESRHIYFGWSSGHISKNWAEAERQVRASMHQEQLFPLIRAKVSEMIHGYIQTEEMQHLDTYIVPASLQDNQGIMAWKVWQPGH
jgi:hypothetical protein